MRGFHVVNNQHRKNKEVEIQLPRRADYRSAGYDFYTPVDVVLEPGEDTLIWTDVKSYMGDHEVLHLYIRSSLGLRGLRIKNQVGVIDSSYYENEKNDGNIAMCIQNTSDETHIIRAGERVMQGVFSTYLTTEDDRPIASERIGGIGSSGKF